MKITVTYLLIAMILIACNSPEKKEIAEMPVSFNFPTLIDKKQITDSLVTVDFLYHGSHYPIYFGKIKDSIIINHNTWPMIPPNPPPGSKEQKPIIYEYERYYQYSWARGNYKSWDTVKLEILIDTSQTISNKNRGAYPVFIKNLEADTVFVGYGDHIPFITEGKTRKGEWKPIEEQYIYMCGVGLPSIILPPDQYVISSQLVYSGDFITQMRIKFGENYSIEFNGSINESQFESEWD